METRKKFHLAKCKVQRQILPICYLPFAFCLLMLVSNTSLSQEQTGNAVELDNDLIFSENWFTDLQQAKATPERVLYLDLSLKKNKTFPPEILTFKNVERLYLSYNYWASLPEEIGTLVNVKIIDLSGNYYLNYLPKEGLSKLPHLELLILKDNKLATREIEKIKKLLPDTKVLVD